ncbi:TIGR04282 family arsenosugar biosynthesis glycosyltransferase [Gloeocapsopsis crepidinum LEGE 06123]|uniref:TIGR04282 family arsenosugar biosynthesis glycosyltransferase n=1 Tax=Gloeocapsopsis crepidinum LEGE 06123 TaxID=588587 RepID=A0ABR9UYW9_9CHRO|nr:TIGR04282 family arsenosugar biosynthesis glycosyltransferase [Gloeocapsopsis crepidinum]MBE9193198.1 TIGR04282 family arsenosugar biosynthesis glycosyltransferase [Gloeocapsopsis crepidinum LEGE 06123]
MSSINSFPEHLIVFTRYPEPGKAKTRLIPALGAAEAAQLQRQMTEHTLLQVSKCDRSLTVEVRFADGNLKLMQEWLGHHLNYQPQGEGDLGTKIKHSLAAAFARGSQRVVTIGTDCPGITAELLAMAFHQLHECDLVLGPAIDGGYYLIGVSRLIAELFNNISWGSAAVLQQTQAIAQKLNLSVAMLPPLADVDRPEDLVVWEQIQSRGEMT